MRLDGPLRALFVDHDADDLDIIGRIEFLQYFFRVRHLRHGFGRHERDGIDVLESRTDQGLQVSPLDVRRNLSLQPLPGIARTFDEFNLLRHTLSKFRNSQLQSPQRLCRERRKSSIPDAAAPSDTITAPKNEILNGHRKRRRKKVHRIQDRSCPALAYGGSGSGEVPVSPSHNKYDCYHRCDQQQPSASAEESSH